MSLPLARPDKAMSLLPSQSALLDAMQLSGYSSEGADYLRERLADVLSQAKLPDYAAIMSEVETFCDNVANQQVDSNNAWAGDVKAYAVPPALLGFQTLQQHLAASAVREIGTKNLDNVTFDFAVSDKAELVRGYAIAGTPLDEQVVAGMDKLFNAWLANQGMISLDGVIYEYEMNEKSKEIQPRHDEQGNPVRAQADKLRSMITDPENGFKHYVQEKNAAVQIIAQDHSTAERKAGPGR